MNQKESEEEGTFYDNTKRKLEKYGIDLAIEKMTKSELKKKVKGKIEQKMGEIVQKASGTMKKLRFLTDNELKRKRYIEEMDGVEC